MKKKLIGLLIIAVVVGGIYGFNYYNKIKKYKAKINDIKISHVEISDIKDGIYQGSFDADVIAAEVEVEVKDKAIKNIKILEHKTDKGARGEAVVQKVIDAQSLEVDVISGASNSSKVILKAIDNALTKG